jgi:cell division protein FtsW
MNFYRANEKKEIGQIDYCIFYTLCILLSIGVVMVYSTSSFYAMFHNNDSMYFFKRQLIWAIIGVISMSVMMSIDYHMMIF